MTKPKFFVDSAGFASSKKLRPNVDKSPPKREFIPLAYASDIELASYGGLGYTMLFDVESYVNYFLIGFQCVETGKYVVFEDSPDSQIDLAKLQWVLSNFRLIGFFSSRYDVPMCLFALRGYNAEMLKYYTNRLIRQDLDGKPERVDWKKEFSLDDPEWDHIDLFDLCPLQGSLKKYGARLHSKRLQELPFEPSRTLTKGEAELVRDYCLSSDIPATGLIFSQLQEQIKLRYALSDKYNVDLRSKSDAQISEAVMKSEVYKKTGKHLKRDIIGAGTTFKYIPPGFLRFQSVGMQKVFRTIQEMEFEIGEDLKMSMPDSMQNLEMTIGKTAYKFGKGGLHSKEKCASYRAENGMLIIDSDVESYYPRLILNSKMYPEAIGPIFLEIFDELVNRRLTAKRVAANAEKELKELFDKLGAKYQHLNLEFEVNQSAADGLKITINGTFGKLGSRWSIMYAPNLLIQVTITGQLALAMLIERLELAGIQVISANTDGIVAYCHESQYQKLVEIRDQWSKDASLKMEETRYKALYSRDVNNYIAIKMEDKVKLKGAYSNPWNEKKLAIFRFHKNPVNTICIEAVEALLVKGTPVEQTIKECRELPKFVTVRDVKGGAHRNGKFLGKTVRYVYAAGETSEINYVLSGNKVPDSEGSFPLMDLPDEFPGYLDYGKYIEKANTILHDIGYYRKPEPVSLF
jgi:hypothetical protein